MIIRAFSLIEVFWSILPHRGFLVNIRFSCPRLAQGISLFNSPLSKALRLLHLPFPIVGSTYHAIRLNLPRFDLCGGTRKES